MYMKDKAQEIITDIMSKMIVDELSLTCKAPSSVIFHISTTNLIIIRSCEIVETKIGYLTSTTQLIGFGEDFSKTMKTFGEKKLHPSVT